MEIGISSSRWSPSQFVQKGGFLRLASCESYVFVDIAMEFGTHMGEILQLFNIWREFLVLFHFDIPGNATETEELVERVETVMS